MSIRKKPSGKWESQPYYQGKKLPARSFERKTDAQRYERDTIRSASQNLLVVHTITMDEMVKIYREQHMCKLKQTTRNRYNGDIDSYILPYFIGQKLDQITSVRCEQFQTHLLRSHDLAPNSINNIANTLNQILSKALAWNWITSKPKRVKPLKVNKVTGWWQDEGHVLAYQNALSHYTHQAGCLMGLECGLRIGEITGLDKSHVNLEGTIHIKQQWSDELKSLQPTKGSHDRVVPFNPSSKLGRMLVKLCEGKRNSDPVFMTKTGRRLRSRDLYETHSRAIKKAGVPHIRFHDMRHTYASWFMKKGMGTIWELKIVLGHKDIATTQQYAHHTPLGSHKQICFGEKVV